MMDTMDIQNTHTNILKFIPVQDPQDGTAMPKLLIFFNPTLNISS